MYVPKTSKTGENVQESCETPTCPGSVRIEEPNHLNLSVVRQNSDRDNGLDHSVSNLISQIIYFQTKIIENGHVQVFTCDGKVIDNISSF